MKKIAGLLLVLFTVVLLASCASTGAAKTQEYDGEYQAPIICEVYYTTNHPVWQGKDAEEKWPRITELVLTDRDSDYEKGARYAIVMNVIDFQFDVCELIVSYNDFKNFTRYTIKNLPSDLQTWYWWTDINILGSNPGNEYISAYALDLQGNKSNIFRFYAKTVKEEDNERPASNSR